MVDNTKDSIISKREKSNEATNYHPITRLPITWKFLTGIIVEELYMALEQVELLPDEQKGQRKEKTSC